MESLKVLTSASQDQEERTNWVDLSDANWVRQIPYNYAKRHHVVAINEIDYVLQVVHSPAMTFSTLEEINRRFYQDVELHQIEQREFDLILQRVYDKGQSEATQVIQGLGDEVDFTLLAQELPQTMDLLESADDAPIIRLINALLTQAIRGTASDIHLEAFENRSVVRFRVDGLLRDIIEPQRVLHSALVSRLKVMAKLDIAEKRQPQDGRMSLRIGDRQVDVRVSVLPTQHGERIVLRLLDKNAAQLNISELGMSEAVEKAYIRLTHASHGIILVTGPTGSGKTTTLYTGISKLDRESLNILTIEDPIEYDLDGVGQTQVNPKIDLTFAAGLRSILRQDPDVVLIGEIRDVETAEIAVQASLTGHLVLSTLHTNSAIGAVTRLMDMGVEPFLISSSLIGVLAQRLVRKLCPHCKRETDPSDRLLSSFNLGDIDRLYEPVGCEQCFHLGYRGRTGIYEVINVNATLAGLIHEQQSEEAMLRHVRADSPSINDSGLDLVRRGITSLDEIVRVTSS